MEWVLLDLWNAASITNEFEERCVWNHLKDPHRESGTIYQLFLYIGWADEGVAQINLGGCNNPSNRSVTTYLIVAPKMSNTGCEDTSMGTKGMSNAFVILSTNSSTTQHFLMAMKLKSTLRFPLERLSPQRRDPTLQVAPLTPLLLIKYPLKS